MTLIGNLDFILFPSSQQEWGGQQHSGATELAEIRGSLLPQDVGRTDGLPNTLE